MTNKPVDWQSLLLPGAVALVGAGMTWTISAVVHGEQDRAVQGLRQEQHEAQLHDHELRTRSLEAVISQVAATQATTSSLLERMIRREEEREKARNEPKGRR